MILLTHDRDPYETRATPDGDDLWLPLADLTPTTGWALKPEGLCRGAVCVPVRDRGFLSESDTRFNVTALARALGQPLVRDAAHGVWSLGEAGGARHERLQSLEAPDFRLPDLEGRLHTLSEHRGRKVFLVSWASW